MPLVYRGRVVELGQPLTKMTMQELIDYETYLWRWMRDSPPAVVTVLNAIYREVEWRAQDTAFR